jgi:hypothetical protein
VRRIRRGWWVAIALLLVVAACDPTAILTFDNASDTNAPDSQVVTQQGSDSYTFTSTAGEIAVAAAPTNTGGNLRALFWPANAPDVVDSMSCATWADQNGEIVQQGAALRIVRDGTRTRAVTVTKNIWFAGYWIFNFHLWDTTTTGAEFTLLGNVDLRQYLGDAVTWVRPLPWKFCARVVGSKLTFKVWLDPEPEPSWTDPDQTGSIALPAAFRNPGKAGWYVAHLPPGGQARFANLRTWRYSEIVPPTTTTVAPTTTTEPEATTTTEASTTTTVVEETTTTTEAEATTTTTEAEATTTTEASTTTTVVEETTTTTEAEPTTTTEPETSSTTFPEETTTTTSGSSNGAVATAGLGDVVITGSDFPD